MRRLLSSGRRFRSHSVYLHAYHEAIRQSNSGAAGDARRDSALCYVTWR